MMREFKIKCDGCKREPESNLRGWYQFFYGTQFTIVRNDDDCELPLNEERRELCPGCAAILFEGAPFLRPHETANEQTENP